MTDTDVKERGPLSKVWPGISLLLCYFHLRGILKEAWIIDGDDEPNRDESAKRLLRMKNVVGYEKDDAMGKLLVQVKSETTPGLIYTT